MSILLNPKKYRDRDYPDERSKEIMQKTIEWFEEKGLAKQKEQYHKKEFCEDFQKFVTEEGIFETLFLPKGYGSDPNQQYVAEFTLHDYPITEADILSRGSKAWDDMLNTINICKFNIGSGATGIVTHSFYEALNHAYH